MGLSYNQPSISGAAANVPDFDALTPVTVDANPANWNPPAATEGWEVTCHNGDNQQVRGLVAPAVGARKSFWIHNGDDGLLKLKHQNAGASASNRFKLPGAADYKLLSGASIIVTYNHSISRWVIVGDGKT